MPVVAGVDSSTQSCTVELRDVATGTFLGRGSAPHPRTHPPRSEQPPDTWWAALSSAIHAASTDAGIPATEINAISIAAQCHGLVLVGRDGRALRDAKLWNDTTSSPQSERMIADWGIEEWVRAVGSAPLPAFTITKLAWMQDHEPGLFDASASVLLPHDYLTYRLTGRHVTDRSDASGTGYFAAHESRWRIDLLEQFVSDRVHWSHLLPTVLEPSEPAGRILAEAAAELGLAHDVLVGPGAGDQHAGAVGLGMSDGEVAYSLGTSGVVLTTSRNPVFDPLGEVDGVADATGGYLPLVSVLNATKVTDTMARWLGVSLDALADLALAAPARADRPVMVAHLDGERKPNRPNAAGLISGLTNETTREDLARTAFEGVLLGLVRGHQRLRSVGASADGVVLATGGGSRSAAYLQLLADLLQQEVVVRDAPDSVARGASVQAAATLEGVPIVDVRNAWVPDIVSRIAPRSRQSEPDIRRRYAAAAAWTGGDRTETAIENFRGSNDRDGQATPQ